MSFSFQDIKVFKLKHISIGFAFFKIVSTCFNLKYVDFLVKRDLLLKWLLQLNFVFSQEASLAAK